MDIDCGPGTAVHLTTQAATKVHRMEFDHATQVVNLAAGEGSYVEYLPDALIPYRDARFYQQTRVTVDPTATVLLSETIAAGRLARGERHAYRLLFSDLEIQRPDGTLLALDTVRLDPHGSGPVTGPAVFADHDLMATLYAVTPLAPAAEVADILHEALLTTGLAFGVSTLPDDCGAWVRVVSSDSCGPDAGDARRVGRPAAVAHRRPGPGPAQDLTAVHHRAVEPPGRRAGPRAQSRCRAGLRGPRTHPRPARNVHASTRRVTNTIEADSPAV